MKPAGIGNLPRREYHRDRDSGMNEWKSLVKHYEEFDMKAKMVERYAKRALQERMRKDLEDQMVKKREIDDRERNR